MAELAERKLRQKAASIDMPNSASGKAAGGVGLTPIDDPEVDPLTAVSDNVSELNDAVETELRAALQNASPEFFEHAVLSLLWAMGYAGAQGEKQHLGKSHDGGIDGVIRQDPLGLQNVYVQAKRYADDNSIGAPDINSFYGALARQGADRGVFITTSRFTAAAGDAAKQFQGRIVLIDGIRLTALMLRYGVGVEPRQKFTVYSVNQDFFEE
ncbi:Mrr restriction system protein [Corynebacterium xerosis]|nr:Mrr restriction system protein [Corynebacterium xerosis]